MKLLDVKEDIDSYFENTTEEYLTNKLIRSDCPGILDRNYIDKLLSKLALDYIEINANIDMDSQSLIDLVQVSRLHGSIEVLDKLRVHLNENFGKSC